ncbi:hypothetical protein [Marinoscillum sp. 108]|uniref:hypothetical protein n=1 Tax=Marinoscillum sp. 108 TaxID=2653151 RepID=UPI0012F05CD7|nr:hypothetical protein [Marinoscillum sp. 108]VXD16577.1 hypothetical protein MARINOS108_120301 [Marinoscillum sp. 108]
MYRLTILILWLGLGSCDLGLDSPNDVSGDYYNSDLMISFRDSSGQDLLDPDTPGYYDTAQMSLFYEVDGELEEVYLENNDLPKQFTLLENVPQNEEPFRLYVSADLRLTSGNTMTYLQLSPADMDTIVCEYEAETGKSENYSYIINVWYNGEQVFPTNDSDIAYFTIEK